MSVKNTFFGSSRKPANRQTTDTKPKGGGKAMGGNGNNNGNGTDDQGVLDNRRVMSYPIRDDQLPDMDKDKKLDDTQPDLIQKIEKALAHQTKLLEEAIADEVDTEKLAGDIAKSVVAELTPTLQQKVAPQKTTLGAMDMLKELYTLQQKAAKAKRVEEVWLIGKKAYTAEKYYDITGEKPDENKKNFVFIDEKGNITGAATEEDFLIYEMRDLPIFRQTKPAAQKKVAEKPAEK